MKVIAILTIILVTSSCSNMRRSGRYVNKNGKWVFESNKTGIANFFRNTRPDTSNYYTQIDNSRFMWPVPASKKITSFYGPRHGKHHDGIDIGAKKGTHIVAADSGSVIYEGRMRGYGKIIVLKHSGGHHTIYAHNRAHHVSKGDKVSRGQVIAQVGATGRATGPHVHFEIRVNNKVRDPARYLQWVNRARVASRR